MTRAGAPYRRTTEALADLLAHSEPGTALPSEPALAEQFGVSRATLREAMRGFEDRGLIERLQGVGTCVRPKVIDAGLEELVSIETLASQIGLEVTMGDLQITKRQARRGRTRQCGSAGDITRDNDRHPTGCGLDRCNPRRFSLFQSKS